MKWLSLSVVVVFADQLTKQLAMAHLQVYQPLPLLPFFNLTLTYNPGAAFSLLSDAGGWQRLFFIGVSVVISTALVIWLVRIPPGQVALPASLALIIGGALGNLWDRLTIGPVVDFLDFYYRNWHWPAFNVADSAICVGAVLLLVCSYRSETQNGVADHPQDS